MADLTFTSDGTLYGWAEGNADDLYTVDVTTGLATLVGNSGIDTRGSGLAANSANVLFFTGDDDDGVLRTIDRFTGLPTTVATLNGTFGDPINALAFGPGDALYGVLSHSGPTRPSELIIINTVTGAISRLGPSIDRLDAIAFELEPIPPIPTLSDAAFVVLAGSLAAVALYRMRRARRT
jgi:hypothetical protein